MKMILIYRAFIVATGLLMSTLIGFAFSRQSFSYVMSQMEVW